jgi:hypothetical protein
MPILRTHSRHSHQLVRPLPLMANTLVRNTTNTANLPLGLLLIPCLPVKAQDHLRLRTNVACQLPQIFREKTPRQTIMLTSTDPVFPLTKPSNTKKSPGGSTPKFLPVFPQLKSRKIFLLNPTHLPLPILPPPHPAPVVNTPSIDATSNAQSQARALRRRHSNSPSRLRPRTPCLPDTESTRALLLFRRFSLSRGCRLGVSR